MRLFSFNTVGKKFMVPMLILTVLLLSLLGMFMAMNSVSTIKNMLKSKANATADFMSKVSIPSYRNFDYLALDNLIHEITKDPEVDFAIFYDSQNKPLTKETKVSASSFIVIERKISDDSGLPLGHLKIGFNGTAISSNLQKSVAILSISIAVAVFLFVIGMRMLTNRVIIRPIMHMKDVSEKMASGDLATVIETGGNDEIVLLGRAINRMASNLKDMITRVGAITDSVSNVTMNIASSSDRVLKGANIQRDTVEKTAIFVEEIDNSISSVSMGADSLAASADEVSSSTIEMTTSIEKVAESANVFSVSASDAASSIEEMSASIKEIAESLELLSASSEETASSLNEINAAVKEVERGALESVGLA
ncbi:MAG: methyl-accepting chemotaxis protein, partial [Nitrospirae bacterium]|nr:methyl-accepting chemotaxis protein [Nitrospirota bacterium]